MNLEDDAEKKDEINEEFLKNVRKLTSEKNNFEHLKNFIESCEKNYTAKPRHIIIDRKYHIPRIFGISGEEYYNIYVLDIRRPKTEDQNNFEQIVARLNEKKEITLSELLKICYDELHFDYVSIVDFACRCNYNGTCDMDCSSSINELKEGKKRTKRKKQKKRKQTRK